MYDQECEHSPLRAHRLLMDFGARRGEHALRLAGHAAIPQVLRTDLLHLLRLNFVPEAGLDSALEADVLFAPFCQDLGNGYYRFGESARLQLLQGLDPAYAPEPTVRSVEVARFLLTYIDQQSRSVAVSYDRVYLDYLEVERWSALGFLDPGVAAAQLAAALHHATARGDIAARVRFSGLASALSTPLARYGQLLAYTAGLEAIENREVEAANRLLGPLGDAEIQVGSIRLRSPRRLLRERAPTSKPAGPREEAPTVPPVGEAAASPLPRNVFLSYSHKDRRWFDELMKYLAPVVAKQHVTVWDDTRIQPGAAWREDISKSLDAAQVAIALVSADYLDSELARTLNFELPRLLERAKSGHLALSWVCVAPCLWDQTPLAGIQAANDVSKPLRTLSRSARERAFVQIAEKIGHLLDSAAEPRPAAKLGSRTGSDSRKRVYLSFRRTDSAQRVYQLIDFLQRRFPEAEVVTGLDVPFAPERPAAQAEGIGSASVLLVLIGPDWTSARDSRGRRRLDDPGDYVRAEIVSAFERAMPVIPILVDKALLPRAEELPPGMRGLTYSQAIELRERTWSIDCEALAAAVQRLLPGPESQEAAPQAEALETAPPPTEPERRRAGSLRVFLATTDAELAPERQRVGRVLAEMGHRVVIHDPDPLASDTMQQVLVDVPHHDVFLAIVGWQYGYIPEEDNPDRLSVTELEYLEAHKARIPCLFFLADESLRLRRASRERSADLRRSEDFRRRLQQGHLVTVFTTPEELVKAVAKGVAQLAEGMSPLTGNAPLDSAAAESAAPASEAMTGCTVLFVGHTIDRPDRSTPRFPAGLEGAARAAIATAVERFMAQPGGMSLGIASGSDGGDLLFHEVCAEKGIRTAMYLPLQPSAFVGTLLGAGREWMERFQALPKSHRVEVVVSAGEKTALSESPPYPPLDPWEANARAMIERALAAGPGRAELLALWTGEPGGPGGPADLVRRAQAAGMNVFTIDPRTLGPSPVEGAESLKSKQPMVYLCFEPRDRSAAKQIADGLRASGIEVWQDEQRLRGGSHWEKLVTQVISETIDYFLVVQGTQTRERQEGYAYMETYLALGRQRQFAPGACFVVSVMLDPEVAAPLPQLAAFPAVHWNNGAGLPALRRTLLADWARRRQAREQFPLP